MRTSRVLIALLVLAASLVLLTASPPAAGAAGPPTTFSGQAITVNASGKASPYPSTISVSGLTGVVTRIKVKLLDLSHGNPDDLDVMLRSPQGKRAVLLSDVGGSTAWTDVDLTLDDLAASALPDSGGIASGSYRPTNVGPGDTWPAPADPGTPNTGFTDQYHFNPNGNWSLFVVDDQGAAGGVIAGGWELTLATATVFHHGLPTSIDDSSGPPQPATPYPSTEKVSGLHGAISHVRVTLRSLTHDYPADVDVMLESPNGTRVVVMSDVGGATPFSGTLVLDDAAPVSMAPGAHLATGLYRPTGSAADDVWPAPVPAGPYGDLLSDFNGQNPNGTWKLYVVDDAMWQDGQLLSWSLEIDTTPGPWISIGSVAVREGDNGQRNAVFTVSLSEKSSVPVTVDYATHANHLATSPADFIAKSGTVTFKPGVLSKSVAIPVVGDFVDEPNEIFSVALSNPVGGHLFRWNGACVIGDDDTETGLQLAIGGVGVVEGDEGTRKATFTVSLSAAAPAPVTFHYATSPGTAGAADYVSKSGDLTIKAGTRWKTISVPITGDRIDEPNQDFYVELSNVVGAIPVLPYGSADIYDDDHA